MKLSHSRFLPVAVILICLDVVATLRAQPLGEPDRGSPGDAMIQTYLANETAKIESQFAGDYSSRESWEAKRPQYIDQYYDMLGLSPRPEKTPLKATVTRSLKRDGYIVDMLHYQSWPGLYVTGNLYRPSEAMADARLPAILYVCGHSGRGRDGNKVAYQSHGIWFARHGYVCLVIDSLQLGEIAATHHGTYRYQRWWWHSRGYTPAGIEAWNGVRGLDYLVSRPDVDPERIGVTGISGGGAATFWIAAADERVRVAVPVSGMADLESYIPNRVINGHCDCMFLHNSHRWPWTRIAGLIAPRPMLFVNSDKDGIFPMDANERVIAKLERLYSLYGASDQLDAVVSVGGHAYRHDIRQAVYRFMNTHLKGDPRLVTDTEVDIVSEGNNPGPYPIPPEQLRVFATDDDLPKDQLNTAIDERFVPIATVAAPTAESHKSWQKDLVDRLRFASFGYFPNDVSAARELDGSTRIEKRLQSEAGIEFRLRFASQDSDSPKKKLLLVVLNEDEAGHSPNWLAEVATADDTVVFCETRGMGATTWTKKNPPNYVQRSHVLLGRTVDTGRVWDVIAAAKYLLQSRRPDVQSNEVGVHVAGKGAAGLIAAYAAILEPKLSAVTIVAAPATHMSDEAPQFLNVLRVCDVPDSLGLLAPRKLHLIGVDEKSFTKSAAIYAAAGAASHYSVRGR